jgi:hypothetical protein
MGVRHCLDNRGTEIWGAWVRVAEQGEIMLEAIPLLVWVLVSAASQAVLAFLGIVVSLHEDWAKQRRGLLLIVFIILGTVGLLATMRQSTVSARDAAKLDTALSSLQQSTDESTRLQNLNTKLQEKLLASNKTIGNLARQSIDTVTGGDSFSYVHIQERFPYVVFIHKGKYPLSNVAARIVPFTNLPVPPDKLMGTSVPLGELIPGASVLGPGNVRFSFSDSGYQNFNVFFTARNGFWTQFIRWQRLPGDKWVQATKVMADNSTKTIYEEIDKEFPRNARGEVDWD